MIAGLNECASAIIPVPFQMHLLVGTGILMPNYPEVFTTLQLSFPFWRGVSVTVLNFLVDECDCIM